MSYLDLTGLRIGKLVVLKMAKDRDKQGNCMWLCQCDCGKTIIKRATALKRGIVRSCGCLILESNLVHGQAYSKKSTSEYRVWCHIKGRCNNPMDESYERYGGRGIKMNQEWANSFQSFFDYVGKKPSKELSLDRIDNNGNYEPGNVRWGTAEIQARNRRSNRWLEYNGERMILIDWAKRFNVHNDAITGRLDRGKTFKEIVEYFNKKNNINASITG